MRLLHVLHHRVTPRSHAHTTLRIPVPIKTRFAMQIGRGRCKVGRRRSTFTLMSHPNCRPPLTTAISSAVVLGRSYGNRDVP